MIILQGNKIERSFSGDVLFDNINIQVDERDRIALVGRNGAGKSTLLKILVGEEAPTSGEINTKRDLNLSYLAQDSRFESSNTIYAEMLNVFADLRADEKRLRDMEMKMAELTGAELDKLMTDYDRLSEDFRQRGGFTYESDIRAILNGFKFDESMWEMPISDLSGGQNTRLALAKMLLEKPELLVLDEPTNDLDMDTLDLLQEVLDEYEGTILLVSHDRDFIDRVVTSVIYMPGDGSVSEHAGSYSDLLEKLKSKIPAKKENKKEALPKKEETPKSETKKTGRLSYNQQRLLEILPDKISELEKQIGDTEAALSDSSLYTENPEKFDTLTKQLEELKAELEKSENQWLEIEMLRESIGA